MNLCLLYKVVVITSLVVWGCIVVIILLIGRQSFKYNDDWLKSRPQQRNNQLILIQYAAGCLLEAYFSGKRSERTKRLPAELISISFLAFQTSDVSQEKYEILKLRQIFGNGRIIPVPEIG